VTVTKGELILPFRELLTVMASSLALVVGGGGGTDTDESDDPPPPPHPETDRIIQRKKVLPDVINGHSGRK
jgi:hypothetical protein